MKRYPSSLAVAAALLVLVTACTSSDTEFGVDVQRTPEPSIEVVASGLINPLGLALLPDGGLLIAEEGTGEGDMSAGVSMLTPDGTVGRVVSGLPSSIDSGDLSGAPLVGVDPDGTTAYVGHFNSGRLLTFPLGDRQPEPGFPLFPEDLGSRMEPLNRVELVNPFDITFDPNGVPVVTDASGDGVAIETEEGTTRFIHRFGSLVDPEKATLKISPVPTGITRVADRYLVTLTGGCPYPANSGQVVSIDGMASSKVIVDRLNMPIDVYPGEDDTLWILEFSQFSEGASCFTGEGYAPSSGRLLRHHPDGTTEAVISELNFPGAVVTADDGSLYITSVFSGELLHVFWEDDQRRGPATPIAAAPAWRFENVAVQAGVDFTHGAFTKGLSMDPQAAMSGGLCWIDYDKDGWMDLYLVNSHSLDERDHWSRNGGLPSNTMLRNDQGVFVDVTAETGTGLTTRGHGCVAADFDGDGWTDLYVTADGTNSMLLNELGNSFAATQVTPPAIEWSSSAAVGDLNGDDLPDLVVGSYIDLNRKIDKPSGAFPQDFLGLANHLFLNTSRNGVLSFSDITTEAGTTEEERTLGVVMSDFDGDGDLDLYFTNDGQPNRLHENITENPGDVPQFTDISVSAGVADSGSGMGIAVGDWTGDATVDLLITNWDRELNAIFQNLGTDEGELTFRQSTFRIGLAGLGNNQTGWGTALEDFDNDADNDMLIVNGHVPISDLEEDSQLVRLYGNLGAEGEQGQFEDWTGRVGLEALGPLMARGSAVADFDNDGDLDIAINTIGGDAVLLRNDNPAGHWLQVDAGLAPGVLVTLTAGGKTQVREQHLGSSYLASEDHRLHFGLGDASLVSRIEVHWPDGTTTTRRNVAADQLVTIDR
ncbi:MAG: hypothetical protein GY788_17970 [bacterium]|nr:hypothetical protein [bacterium]